MLEVLSREACSVQDVTVTVEGIRSRRPAFDAASVQLFDFSVSWTFR